MNSRHSPSVIQSAVKGAAAGATLGCVLPIASFAFPSAFPVKGLSNGTYQAMMLSVAVVGYLHQAIPACVRPSEWLSPLVPEFAAPIIDLAAAGFAAGVACHGLFAASRVATNNAQKATPELRR